MNTYGSDQSKTKKNLELTIIPKLLSDDEYNIIYSDKKSIDTKLFRTLSHIILVL